MRSANLAILCALLSVPALGQASPDAAAILEKVANTYASLTQWDFAATITSVVEPGGPFAQSLRTAGKGSSKRRLEVGNANSRKTLILADGQNFWAYTTENNQYTKKAQAPEPAEMLLYFNAILLAYQGGAEATDARLLPEETIEIGNTKTDCYVIQFRGAHPSSVFTWWVDKRRFVVLRDEQAGGPDPSFVRSSTIFTSTQTNGIPDDLFIFTPPPGAKEQAAP
jgi:outer membrane lipoprotein-sorting protein